MLKLVISGRERNLKALLSLDRKPDSGVKVYKKGSYHDYLPIEAIRSILDIVDPSWNEPDSEEEREYIEELERKESSY